MASAEDLHQILDRIAASSYTDTDIAEFGRALRFTGQNRLQLGKYHVHVTEGNDIQIGDRIYQGIDADTIKDFINQFLNAITDKALSGPEPKWPQVRAWYLEQLHCHFNHWSEKYTDLRLTTDIRVATYKGQRVNNSKERGKWWFHEALNRNDGNGQPLRECVVILGDPGGGKTTACQRSAWEFAISGLADQTNPRIPLYLELNGYRKDLPQLNDLAPYQRLLGLFSQEMKRLLAIYSVSVTPEELESYVQSSPFIFFLDGLNEVGIDHRESLIADILKFINTFGGRGHQFVITTRKFDYEYDLAPFLPSERFQILEILELDGYGLNEFIMRDLGHLGEIYHAAQFLTPSLKSQAFEDLERLRRGEGLEDEDFLRRIRKLLRNAFGPLSAQFDGIVSDLALAQQLVKTLRHPDYSRVLWLAQNPSTLKDIIDVYRAEGNIPHSRVLLFERAIHARLAAQEAKLGEQRSRFPKELKFDALQKIALQMMEPKEGLLIEEARAIEIITDVLAHHQSSVPAKKVLDECVFHDGLLVEKTFGRYAFVKQPYQEYFVAREIRDRWLAIVGAGKNPLNDTHLQSFFNNRYHFQVVSSMAGLLSSEEVHGLLQRLRRRKVTQRLAALCIRNAEELPEQAVSEYTDWTKRRILRFAMLPEGIVNASFIFILVATVFLSISVDTRLLAAKGSLAISQFLADLPFTSLHYLIFAVVISATAIGAQTALRRVSRHTGQAGGWVRFDRRAVQFIVIAQGVILLAPSNWAAALIVLTGCLWGFLLIRAAVASVTPAAMWVTTQLEEYIVNRHLIHYLEVLRDMGPNATSTISEIQYTLAKDRFMSARIKDTIQRTWAVSPRTVLQVIKEINITSRQAEAVKVLMTAASQAASSNTLRDKAVAALFQIAKCPGNSAIMLGALDALGKLALEQEDYRSQVVDLLKQVLADSRKYQIDVRRRAWRNLYNLGMRDVIWPKSSFRDLSLGRVIKILLFAGLLMLLLVGVMEVVGR